MRHNGMPKIALSSLAPNRYELINPLADYGRVAESELRPSVICASCGHWELLERSMVVRHCRHGVDHGKCAPCLGSAQRYTADVTFQEWSNLLGRAESSVHSRRAGAFGPRGRRQGRVMRKPQPPVPVPVCRPIPS